MFARNGALVVLFGLGDAELDAAAAKAGGEAVPSGRRAPISCGPHGSDSIRANAVAPGWVRTPMSTYEMQLLAEQNAATANAEVRSVERRIALGRTAAPAEIAASCLFLGSDGASFITGAVLVVDGGGRSLIHRRAI
nr:SDR family oxidoreductase [Bradyrhizobium sp. WSM1253]